MLYRACLYYHVEVFLSCNIHIYVHVYTIHLRTFHAQTPSDDSGLASQQASVVNSEGTITCRCIYMYMYIHACTGHVV